MRMVLATTREQKDSIRAQLAQAQVFLSQRFTHERDTSRQDLFKTALLAVRDALVRLERDGDALMVLAALNGVTFARLDGESARCVERARLICRGSLIRGRYIR